MRKVVLAGVAATAMVATAACQRGRAEDGGPTIQRNFQVGSFEEIEVGGPYDVTVRTGSGPSVSASGPEKLIERMIVEVRGDKLVIRTEERHGMFSWGSHTRGTVKLQVAVPSLTAAVIAGAGGIAVDKVKADHFSGTVGGAGDLILNSVDVQSLRLAIGGSGDIRASGQARNASYTIAGSGDVDAQGVRSEVAEASIAGSGSIRAQATGTADAKIMGSGDITLTGGAKCTVSKMGSGDIHCS